MPLDKASINWALSHLSILGDSDLFPKPVELKPLLDQIDDVNTLISSRDVSQFMPNPARRFMVPKDELSFRRATQLNVFDSVILTAIMHQYGGGIEKRRHPIDENIVFSYRYGPKPDYWLYNRDYNWTPFWRQCYEKSKDYSHALLLDISDFYNQIYHHTIELQLTESGFPKPAVRWIMNLLKSLTAKVSRGIPVGPHAAHLLAEASLIPLDNSLTSHGIEYVRFVDDIIVFENGAEECRKQLYQIADILDKQQRLILNKSKTLLHTQEDIQKLCSERIEDRPINDLEKQLLHIIRKYSGGNPYQIVLLSEVTSDDLAEFRTDVIESILQEYLDSRPTDFIRFRWFLRRLTQIGHPGAVHYCLTHLESLTPALSDVCHYLLAASQNQNGELPDIGKELVLALDNDLIRTNEYFQICILSLFGRNAAYNHFPNLLDRYGTGSSHVKREIILAARSANNSDWLRELKESFLGFESWTATAFLVAAKSLPEEERRFFVNGLPKGNDFIELIKKWTKSKS
ncbi:MAG: Retron-type reverse transcriptase [Planctomycetes bacterium B3_Pla]|nr:MAG: Retron-type reverse transcriptase [Planctomycetes bacterium B3_Pla]